MKVIESMLEGEREIRAQIHDHQGEDRKQPRLTLIFETGVFDCSCSIAETRTFQVDVIETLKEAARNNSFGTALDCPAIAPVIRRWQSFVRLYHSYRQSPEKDNVPTEVHFYRDVAAKHLRDISPLLVEAAEKQALPAQSALLVGPTLDEELRELNEIYHFMRRPLFKSTNNTDAKFKLIRETCKTKRMIDFFHEDKTDMAWDSVFNQKLPSCSKLEAKYLAWRFQKSVGTVTQYKKVARQRERQREEQYAERHSTIVYLKPTFEKFFLFYSRFRWCEILHIILTLIN